MKAIQIFFACVFPLLFLACGSQEEEPPKSNFLDSLYTESGFRQDLDSIQTQETIEMGQFKDLRRFIIKYRDRIPESLSYREIMEASQQAEKLYEGAISMHANNLWMRKEGKMIEFRFELSAHNRTDETLSHFRGELLWLDNDGSTIWKSPRFSVVEEMAPGDSVAPLRLQTAYNKPMGNELNDPRKEAFRDTLDKMVKVAQKYSKDNFRFELTDMRLGNGLSPVEQMLGMQPPVADNAEGGKKKNPNIQKWIKVNQEWMDKLNEPMSPYFVEVTPVLTSRGEASHGMYLLYDRIRKIRKVLIVQGKVPSDFIHGSDDKDKLKLMEVVDFWNWPMEVRIYEAG